MSLLNWFSRKSGAKNHSVLASNQPQRSRKSGHAQEKILSPMSKLGLLPGAQLVEGKVKRHARREQLYVAIRECMNKAGVLSASYKFKVLSLDQCGDQFLVMLDVTSDLGGQPCKLTEIETLLINTAKSLFSIYVTSVYWRTDSKPVAVNFGINQQSAVASKPLPLEVVRPAVKQPGAQRYDPIHDDEMAAFKQALVAASSHNPATPDGTGKSRSGLRSFTLITGFEDTEMSESSDAPALSATQYGELR